jgi:hypothetical protein
MNMHLRREGEGEGEGGGGGVVGGGGGRAYVTLDALSEVGGLLETGGLIILVVRLVLQI